MQMYKDANNESALVSWDENVTNTNNFCVNFVTFWKNFGVGIISGPPVVWPTLAPVQFSAGPGDIFYGTDLDMDNAFAIVGRSTVMDVQAAASGSPRVALPGKCPGI